MEKRWGIDQPCGVVFIFLLDLKRLGEVGSTKEEFSLTAFGMKRPKP